MRIHITEVQIGDQLTSSVFNNHGLHVLSANTQLDADGINKLHQHHIDFVDIVFRHAHHFAAETIITAVLPKFNNAVSGMKDLFDQVSSEGNIDVTIVNEKFDPLIEQFNKEKDVVSLLLTLTNKDDYTYQHCVQVGMIAYYIAHWIGLPEEQALICAKSGFLHDIGKSQIDSAILNKTSKLTSEEFEAMKQHTSLGSNIIQKSFMDHNDFSLVALQHHERLNGKGYPSQLTKDQIHPISRIIAVADVYSAMISARVYQQKKDLLFVLKELHRLSFNELDPHIVQTFIQKMIPNFIGKNLSLKSGEVGSIIMTNPSDVFRPLIKINDTFIDLSKHLQYEVDVIYL